MRAAGGRGAILQFPVCFFFLSFFLPPLLRRRRREGNVFAGNAKSNQSSMMLALPSSSSLPLPHRKVKVQKEEKKSFSIFPKISWKRERKFSSFLLQRRRGRSTFQTFFFFRVISFAFYAGNHCVRTLSRTESGKKKACVILTTYTQKRHTKNGGDRCPLLTSNNPVRTTVPLILINIPPPICVFSFVGVSCFPNNWKRRTQKMSSSPPLTPSSPLNWRGDLSINHSPPSPPPEDPRPSPDRKLYPSWSPPRSPRRNFPPHLLKPISIDENSEEGGGGGRRGMERKWPPRSEREGGFPILLFKLETA